MGYVGKVTDTDGTTGLIGSTLYGTCSTAADTVAKVGTCSDFDTLIDGVTIHIKFTNSNTATNPTLNVNGTGAKRIYKNGTTSVGKTVATSWAAGSVVSLTYDGTAWQMNDHTDNTNTTYSAGTGLTLSSTTFNHSNSITAGTAKGDDSKTLTFGGTFTIPTVTYDAQGHITGKGTTTMTMPANPDTDAKVVQSSSTTSNYRPVMLGYTSTTNVADLAATVTNQVYATTSLFHQPSTGYLYATEFYTKSYLSGTGSALCGTGLYLRSYFKRADNTVVDYRSSVLRTYNGKITSNDGLLLAIGGGGLTIVGGGESATSLADLISNDQTIEDKTTLNVGGTLNTSLVGNTERLIMSSDDCMFFITNCQTIANRKPVVLDTNSYFYPGTTGTGSLGTSTYKWNSAYINTIYGAFKGTVYHNATNPTSESNYPVSFGASSSDFTSRYSNIGVNDGISYRTAEGTTSANGFGVLCLGNSIASGTAGNKYGGIRFYSSAGTYYTQITPTTLTATRQLSLPNKGGTIAVTSDIPTVSGVYLPLAGGTMTGDITFTSISGDSYPIVSKGIKWGGGTDAIDMYYNLRASDAGELIINMRDDTNVRTSFAYNGTVKSYIDTNGVYNGTATTATTATKATQDGDGNTISSTYLKLSGGTMTGQLKTSFKESVAVGSYQAQATKIPDLCTELRYSSGAMGSVALTEAYTKDGITIAATWYNFIWIPHRSGGVNGAASGDNCNFGSLILSGMTGSGAFIIRYASGSIAELKYLYKDTTYSANNGVGLSGTTFYNSGVRAVSTGSANGTISVNTNGTSADVAVLGLKSAAYTESSDYVPKTTVSSSTDADTLFSTTQWVNWNTATAIKTTHMPTANYGLLLVKASPGPQVFFPDTGTGIYLRKKAANSDATAWMGITGNAGATYNLSNFYKSTTSRTANTVLAAPNGSDGAATFRKLVAADIPDLSGTYLPLSGGTMTGDIEYPGPGGRKTIFGKSAFMYYVASTSSWFGGLNYYSSDGSTGLGAFGAYGTANTLSYHYIGGTYNAPQIKIEPTGPNLIINSEDASTPMITLFRKGNNKADWRIINNAGTLYFQSDYTDTVGSWYNVLNLSFNSGDIAMKSGALFTFGAFGSGTADANRPVLFKDNNANKIVTNTNFQYNPSTNILTVGSITGSAAAWTTARTLTLSGQLTGSVSVKGDANMTLSGWLKKSLIYDETSDFASYAWHKFAEKTITNKTEDQTITFIVSKTWGNVPSCSGILTAHIRTGSTKVYETSQFYWQLANTDIDPENFVFVYTNTTDTSCKVELWYKQTSRYDGWIFTVLKEHSRTSNNNVWTLYTSAGHGSASHTTGTASYASTIAGIKNNTSGTSSNVTGTVAIANGGTGATTRLGALKALTNENVGIDATYFLTITDSKGGYTSVANAKTVLGLKSAAYTDSSAYAASDHTHPYLPTAGTTINNPNTSSVSFTNGMSGNILFTNTGDTNGVARGIGGIVGGSDSWSVRGYQTATNKGCLEISVGDDGDEGIYVRQYTSGAYKATFSNNAGSASGLTYRELVLMAPSTGASVFPSTINTAGNITITKASGDTGFYATRSDTSVTVWMGVGSGGTNHGVYSNKLGKWMMYGDASNVYLNGNAATATTSTNLKVPRVAKDSKVFPGANKAILEEYTNGTSYNLPSNHFYHILSIQGHDTKYGTQLALGMTTTAAHYRSYNNQTWSAWKSIINTDTYDRNRYNASIKAGSSALVAANIIVGKDGVYKHLKSGGAFDITYPILYLAGAVDANGTTTNTYDIIHFTITTTQSITLAAYRPVYIKGILNGTVFTPVSATPLIQTIPTSGTTYDYIYLGQATSSTTVYLQERHPIYSYRNGRVQEITPCASMAATSDGFIAPMIKKLYDDPTTSTNYITISDVNINDYEFFIICVTDNPKTDWESEATQWIPARIGVHHFMINNGAAPNQTGGYIHCTDGGVYIFKTGTDNKDLQFTLCRPAEAIKSTGSSVTTDNFPNTRIMRVYGVKAF